LLPKQILCFFHKRKETQPWLPGYKRSLLTYCTDHDKELVATFENGETVKAVIWRRSIPARLRLSIQTWQSNMVKAFQEIEQYCHEWELLHLSVITLITYSCIAGKYIILNVHNSFCIVFVSAKQIYMLSQTWPYCYRMLAHSHSATSLYNLSQFKPISDSFTSIVYILPASNLGTGIL
jgi:hypothetical protein